MWSHNNKWHELNHQWTSLDRDKKSRSTKGSNTTLSSVKDNREFDVIQSHKPLIKPMYGQKHQKGRTKKLLFKHAQNCKYCGSSHPPRRCSAHVKTCRGCEKINHFWAVCKALKAKEKHSMKEQITTADQQVNTVNIISFNFNSIHSVIIAKLKTRRSQNSAIIQHKVDTSSDGNIMPYHIFKILYPRVSKELLIATKIEALY